MSSQGQCWDGLESEQAGISGNDMESAAASSPSGISDKNQLRPKLLSPSFSPRSCSRTQAAQKHTRMLEFAHILKSALIIFAKHIPSLGK